MLLVELWSVDRPILFPIIEYNIIYMAKSLDWSRIENY